MGLGPDKQTAPVYLSPGGMVTVYSPTASTPYFRLAWTDPDFETRRQTKAGRDLSAAMLRAESLERRLASAAPRVANATLFSDLIEAFMDPERVIVRRKDGQAKPWSDGYRAWMTKCAHKMHTRLGPIKLEALTQRHVAALVNSENTYSQAERLRSAVSALVGYGVDKGFLRQDQKILANVDVAVAVGQRSRALDRGPIEGEHEDLVPDNEIPTIEAFAAFTRALDAQPGTYRHFVGLAETLAFCGCRIHEALALTAADVLGTSQRFVLPRLAVTKQVVELRGGGLKLTAPKNGRRRQVSIIEVSPTGFELAAWLLTRAEEARTECAGGRNEQALLFPTPRGHYWRLNNLRRRVFDPAAEAAGWPYRIVTAPATWVAQGEIVTQVRAHRLWDHTIHSLRHLFATTAINDWGWRDDVLCMAGGWTSEEFVREHYYARTPSVVANAQAGQVNAAARYRTRSPQAHTAMTASRHSPRSPDLPEAPTDDCGRDLGRAMASSRSQTKPTQAGQSPIDDGVADHE